jgi:transposase InsO family protein
LIDAEKESYCVFTMCRQLGVSRSGFYEWQNRPPSPARLRTEQLDALIAASFTGSDCTYGYRRVAADLARQGVAAGAELVRRRMRAQDLHACQQRPYRPTTTRQGGEAPAPDLVDRDFTAAAPGEKLVGDITYIPSQEGFAYLATVIDCCTKECVGYAIADHMRTALVIDALDMAARNGRPNPDAIFHTDRGSQYTAHAFAAHAASLGVRQSMGRTGICFDNAAAESFNSAVKVERVNRCVYPTIDDARKDVSRYIEIRYNTRRLHSALGYRTPREAYLSYINTAVAA